jgi:hypothetical protein
MIGVTAEANGLSVLDFGDDGTGVGAVVRASAADAEADHRIGSGGGDRW